MNKLLNHIMLRDELMRATRTFFSQRKFHEVIPPILNNAVPNEPNLYPFVTSWNRSGISDNFYLPTSPERSLKMALGAGLGNCYAIGHCFRNLEGSGSLHSPEFLMLEWYRVQSTYQEIMKEVQEIITFVDKQVILGVANNPLKEKGCFDRLSMTNSTRKQWSIISIKERFEMITDTSYENLLTDDQTLIKVAKKLDYAVENASWREVFDQILVNEIEAYLPKDPVFLIDFPSRISPLCKKKTDEPHIAERFELYIGGVEIANGNNENTNVGEIREIFEKELKNGKSPLDSQFLEALQAMHDSGNHFAGVGLGVDRLLMVMTGENKIVEL